jgi:hypothetical protein
MLVAGEKWGWTSSFLTEAAALSATQREQPARLCRRLSLLHILNVPDKDMQFDWPQTHMHMHMLAGGHAHRSIRKLSADLEQVTTLITDVDSKGLAVDMVDPNLLIFTDYVKCTINTADLSEAVITPVIKVGSAGSCDNIVSARACPLCPAQL